MPKRRYKPKRLKGISKQKRIKQKESFRPEVTLGISLSVAYKRVETMQMDLAAGLRKESDIRLLSK